MDGSDLRQTLLSLGLPRIALSSAPRMLRCPSQIAKESPWLFWSQALENSLPDSLKPRTLQTDSSLEDFACNLSMKRSPIFGQSPHRNTSRPGRKTAFFPLKGEMRFYYHVPLGALNVDFDLVYLVGKYLDPLAVLEILIEIL